MATKSGSGIYAPGRGDVVALTFAHLIATLPSDVVFDVLQKAGLLLSSGR